ncbi:peptide chain release factor 2 [candidate division WS5 bacterium]|uniref:Peptide chain release factor 2 n=1 Tax=candidate division WS5 bacterium TaxID=2093353 RepID=A0A419DAH6_9BACT|nr:MAG: peptide chain release factor 2 [candidate division WS5 bacterium]
MKAIVEPLEKIAERVERAEKALSIPDVEKSIKELEGKTSGEGFWDNSQKASRVMAEIADLKKQVTEWKDLKKRTDDLLEIARIAHENDHEIIGEVKAGTEELVRDLDKAEFTMLFSGPYDKNNAILSIYAGSGGVDAQDWAEMLLRMYLKFAEKQGFSPTILSISSGDEAGIKSVTVEVVGLWAYGYLRSEAGVHRLVRLSPYDADKARHTSFALVDVIPEIEKEDIQIEDKDLKIETFKASGHGGQGVNTTDSAVRIKHIPSGIVVTCQKERSQLQNKEYALKVLASRLKILEEKKTKKEISEIRGESVSAEWGNQIRSYVLHPYNMVKDHRTGQETSNTGAILEGGIDEFIERYLRDNVAKK